MSFSINTNVTSLQAQNNLRASSDFQSKTINRVTSGLRIVNSGDDAAGLAIANGFRSDQAVLTQGIRNANDALSTLQTIDGGMNNISMLLDRARTLATQSASGAFAGGADGRKLLNTEFQSVMSEIDRQSQAVGMNQNGDFAKSLSVFIGGGRGPSSSSVIGNGSVTVDLSKSTVDTTSLGLNSVRAVNTGYDIGALSSTSVTSILKNVANVGSELSDGAGVSGTVRFKFAGAGFTGINVDVNVAGVKDSDSLVTAINTAIKSAGSPPTSNASATAFKNAGMVASIATDANGRQQVSFSAPNAAFQVVAGDKTANALLGNLEGTSGQGATLKTSSTGAGVAASATGGPESFIINGTILSLGTVAAGATVDQRATAFRNAIAASRDASLNGQFTAVADAGGTKIRIENTQGNSFTISAANAATKTDFGLSGSVTVASQAVINSVVMVDQINTNKAAGGVTSTAAGGGAGAGRGTYAITVSDNTGDHLLNIDTTGGVNTTQGRLDLITAALANVASGIVGKYTVSDGGANKGLTFTATDLTAAATFSFKVVLGTGIAADLGVVADATNNASDTISAGAAAAGSGVGTVTIAGGHTLNITTVAGDDTSTLVTKLQNQIDLDTAPGGAAGKYTVSETLDHKLVITATDTASASFAVTATGTGVSDLMLVSGNSSANVNMTTSDRLTSTQANSIDGGGAQISSQYADAKAYTWTALAGSQNVTFSGSHADGTQFSWTTTLNNANASTLGTAITQLNTALQGSSDASLKNIVAVKDADSTNALGIRFMSSDAFTVNMGTSTVTPGQGLKDGSLNAINNGQGAILLSGASAGAGTADISNQTAAASAVSELAGAVSTLGAAQAVVGKGQNNFNYAMNLAQSQSTNLAAAESRIRDADLASEAANLTKAQILIQAGTAALAQANSAPQAILSLLK